MSQEDRPAERDPGTQSPTQPYDLDDLGIDSVSSDFGHHSEQSDLHHHVSLLYENQTDQFAAVIPFLREGLQRGDRCLYIYDDNEKEAVVAAMSDAGIDVDAAVEAGDLSFHAKEGPFLQDGTFDPDDTIEFANETIRESTEENGYDSVRIAGEMTWILDGEHELDRMIEYEQRLNSVFGERPVIGLCQYNVSRFDPELLNQITRVHPSLIYAGTIAQDFYYVPSDKLLGANQSDADEESLPQTLLERVTAYETLQQRERALSELTDAAQELMHLDAEEIPDRTVDLVREVLDTSFVSFWSYNESTGTLEIQASSSDHTTTTALAERYRDHAWEAFVSEQMAEFDELPIDFDSESGDTQLTSGVIVPLGRHGVFCAGSVHRNAFDDAAINLVTTLGANVEAALDRSDRERSLAEANEQLERVNRINRVIRRITEALVDAETRDEIEQIVCEQLAASDPYQFAWIGDREIETERIEPRSWSSEHADYLNNVAITTDDKSTGRGPITKAAQTETMQVVQDVLTDQSFAPWREPTLGEGFRACISVPLVHEDLCYGILTLYADTPNVFDEQERAVLEELGELIAHSIDAAETKETLRTDSVVELTFTVRGFEDLLTRLAGDDGSEIQFDGLVEHSNAPSHLFFTVSEGDPGTVIARADDLTGISEIEGIRETETRCSFKAAVTEPTLASRILEQQTVIRSLTVTGTAATVTLDLPAPTAVREFLNDLRQTYPDIELVSRQTQDRPIKTGEELRDAIGDRLTDRQWEILETAYRSGFFESPRAQTGTEISEALGISQSTFTHHLREAERRLCELVLDNS